MKSGTANSDQHCVPHRCGSGKAKAGSPENIIHQSRYSQLDNGIEHDGGNHLMRPGISFEKTWDETGERACKQASQQGNGDGNHRRRVSYK